MTKEGLIILRDNIKRVKEEKKYNLIQCYNVYDGNYNITYLNNKRMIIELAKYCEWQNELDALNYLEKSFKNILENSYKDENDIKNITSVVTVYFFVSNKFIENLKYDINDNYVSKGIDKNELLKPYVVILFSNYVDNLYTKPVESKSFVVNYNIFSEILKRHGYEISIDNYDDLLENHIKQINPVIELDFEKEKVKKLNKNDK